MKELKHLNNAVFVFPRENMIQFRYPSYHPLGKKLNTSDRKNINLLPNKEI